jgi:WD40 repeat protein
LGEALSNGLKNNWRDILRRLRGASEGPLLPLNQDMARAVRRAELLAFRYLIGAYPFAVLNPGFATVVADWVALGLRKADERDFRIREAEWAAALTPSADATRELTGAEAFSVWASSACAAAWDDLTFHCSLRQQVVPEDFRAWFDGGHGVGWFAAAHAFFIEQVKKDEPLRTAVFLDLAQATLRGLDQVQSELGELGERVQVLEKALNAASAARLDMASLAAAVADALGRPDFLGRLTALLPPSGLMASQAANQVRLRVEELDCRFVGRTSELAVLDHFVESRPSGLIEVCGPGGTGKSALLARWMEQRRALGDHVVRHFIGAGYGATRARHEIMRHLAVQLRALHPDLLPRHGDRDGIGDETFEVLRCDRSQGDRLILILDGLDEADELVEPFVDERLGDGVHIVLGCRASLGHIPRPLGVWNGPGQRDLPRGRLDVPSLALDDTLLWLEEIVGRLPQTEMRRLVGQLQRVTDGLPLFLRYFMEDLGEKFEGSGAKATEVLEELPHSFNAYVRAQIAGLDETNWPVGLQLAFALLCRTIGPISERDLAQMVRPRRELDIQTSPVSLGLLPHTVERWLTIVGAGPDRTFSFAHPRLADVFGKELDYRAEDAERVLEYLALHWRAHTLNYMDHHGLEHLFVLARMGKTDLGDALKTLTDVSRLAVLSAFPGAMARLISSVIELSSVTPDPEPAKSWLGSMATALPFLSRSRTQREREQLLQLAIGPSPRGKFTPQGVLQGHQDEINGAMPLNDGRLLSWSDDKTLRLWDSTGAPLAVLQGHSGYVSGALALDDGRVLSWSRDGTLRLWDSAGAPLAVLEGHGGGVGGALALDNGRLLSWSWTELRLWDSGGALLTVLQGHAGQVGGATALDDGRILSWSWDRTLRLWDGSGTPLAVLRGHTGDVRGALALADGRLLSWSEDQTLRLWDSASVPLAVLQGHEREVSGALALGDGRLLSWSVDGSLRLWDSAGKPLAVLQGHEGGVFDVLVLADGRLLSWGWDDTLRLWDNAGEVLAVLRGHKGPVRGGLALSDGRFLSWGWDDALRLWDSAGTPLAVLEGHTRDVYGACTLSDGRILSWSEDGTLRLWDGASAPHPVFQGHRGEVLGALALADGRLLSWSEDGTLRLWDSVGTPLIALQGHEEQVSGAVALDDGRLLSWSGDETLRLWDNAGAPQVVLRGHEDPVEGGAALDDGRLLSWSDDGTLRLWDSAGAPLAVLQGHEGRVSGAAVMGEGRLLSWSWDDTLRLWDSAGAPLAVLQGHDDGIMGATALNDGRILSWSWDRTLRLWDRVGSPLSVLRGHEGRVSGALVLRDSRLLSWSRDGTLRLWDTVGTPLAVLEGHEDEWVSGALPLGDGRFMSWGLDLRLWDADGTALAVLRGHSDAIRGALDLGDRRLLSWSDDGTLRLWADAETAAIWSAFVGPISSVVALRAEQPTFAVIARSTVLFPSLAEIEGRVRTDR